MTSRRGGGWVGDPVETVFPRLSGNNRLKAFVQQNIHKYLTDTAVQCQMVTSKYTICNKKTKSDYMLSLLESGWVIYGQENGYNFPHPRLLRVKSFRTANKSDMLATELLPFHH